MLQPTIRSKWPPSQERTPLILQHAIYGRKGTCQGKDAPNNSTSIKSKWWQRLCQAAVLKKKPTWLEITSTTFGNTANHPYLQGINTSVNSCQEHMQLVNYNQTPCIKHVNENHIYPRTPTTQVMSKHIKSTNPHYTSRCDKSMKTSSTKNNCNDPHIQPKSYIISHNMFPPCSQNMNI